MKTILNKGVNFLGQSDVAMTLLRVAIGVVFINAGWMKIQNTDMMLAGFASMGFPSFLVYVVMYAEFIGGIMLVLGLWVRYAAMVLGGIMLVALFKVHLSHGFSIAQGGFEYVLVLGAGLYALLTNVSSGYSLQKIFRR